MTFEQLRTEDLVCWSDELREDSHHLPTGPVWAYEPFDCVLQVVKVTLDDLLDPVVHLDCVMSCGLHEVLSITQDDWDTCEQILDVDMLRYATMEEAGCLHAFDIVTTKEGFDIVTTKEGEDNYNLEEDIGYIFGLLRNDNLSVRRRRWV